MSESLKQKLKSAGFSFKHKFGQNFITDTNLLGAIAGDAQIEGNDNVLEIGTGAGTLTAELCKRARKVVSVEIDESLKDFLEQNLKEYKNLHLEFGDFLKIPNDTVEHWFEGEEFKVVANLPYYVSTPIILKFIESELNIKSITVMLQYELAERITARPGGKDYGSITVAVDLWGRAGIMRKVSRKLFIPEPNVDSAVVRIDVKEEPLSHARELSKFVQACFSMRRKTLGNCLANAAGLGRERAKRALEAAEISANVRAETLTTGDFVRLFEAVKNLE